MRINLRGVKLLNLSSKRDESSGITSGGIDIVDHNPDNGSLCWLLLGAI